MRPRRRPARTWRKLRAFTSPNGFWSPTVLNLQGRSASGHLENRICVRDRFVKRKMASGEVAASKCPQGRLLETAKILRGGATRAEPAAARRVEP